MDDADLEDIPDYEEMEEVAEPTWNGLAVLKAAAFAKGV